MIFFGSSLNDLIVKEGTIIGAHINRDGSVTYSIDWSLKGDPPYVKYCGSLRVPEEYLYIDKQELLKKYYSDTNCPVLR